MKDALIPMLEATDRSILPVTIMKTIGNIINPISMKSEDVRERLPAFRKNGESRVLIKISTRMSAASIHSQRRNPARNERDGAYSLMNFDSFTISALISSHFLYE